MYSIQVTGKELRSLRQRRGLSLALFAPSIGVHWNTLARYERNEIKIPTPVANLARRLEATARLNISTSEANLKPQKKKGKRMLRSHYSTSRGGHAPGHLREAFEEYWINPPADFGGREEAPVGLWRPEPGWIEKATVELDGEKVPMPWLVGQLWNCSDIMPEGLCSEMDLPPGTTYAQAVRTLRE